MAKKVPRGDPSFPVLGPEDFFPFPSPSTADEWGVVCSGGNLSPGLLLSAYRQGIFPWFSEDEPLLWWSPDPRFVLFPEKLHVTGTMRKLLKKRRFELSLDRDFEAVIRACSSLPRKGQQGTWITEDMIEAYVELHRLGYAHSAEARLDGRLVGGLYGVSLGSIFFGESMFSREDDASKAAFIPLVLALREEGFTLIDSQVYTDHLAGLGAEEIGRNAYLGLLETALRSPTRRGSWASSFSAFPDSAGYRHLIAESEQPKRP
jgi:leucyl/phenylalanyl-tRNA--protein transferase